MFEITIHKSFSDRPPVRRKYVGMTKDRSGFVTATCIYRMLPCYDPNGFAFHQNPIFPDEVPVRIWIRPFASGYPKETVQRIRKEHGPEITNRLIQLKNATDEQLAEYARQRTPAQALTKVNRWDNPTFEANTGMKSTKANRKAYAESRDCEMHLRVFTPLQAATQRAFFKRITPAQYFNWQWKAVLEEFGTEREKQPQFVFLGPQEAVSQDDWDREYARIRYSVEYKEYGHLFLEGFRKSPLDDHALELWRHEREVESDRKRNTPIVPDPFPGYSTLAIDGRPIYRASPHFDEIVVVPKNYQRIRPAPAGRRVIRALWVKQQENPNAMLNWEQIKDMVKANQIDWGAIGADTLANAIQKPDDLKEILEIPARGYRRLKTSFGA